MTGDSPAAAERVRVHVIALLDPARSGPVEQLRQRWDPVMASQVRAHVTLVYPEEVPAGADIAALAAKAAASTPPFTIAVGQAFYVGSPADGVFLHVRDPDGGMAAFRAAAIPPGGVIDFPRHVTIVHPRTSDRGTQAWAELAVVFPDVQTTVTEVLVTACINDQWHTLRRLPLTGHDGPAGAEQRVGQAQP